MNTFSPALSMETPPLCTPSHIVWSAKAAPNRSPGILASRLRCALASLGIAQSSEQAQALVPCRFPPASIVLEHFATKQSPSPSETETGIHTHKL